MRKLIVGLLFVCIAGGVAFAWHSPIAAIEPATRPAFEPALVKRGEMLAAMGNCGTCHTRPGGKGLEGGLAIPTPFGEIYSTNITPDVETGIGRWPETAFARAMREGVDLNGKHLYPAFPYDHFTLLSDEDVHALYAYVMTRGAVKESPHPNGLSFPFNFRPAIAVWKAIYFRDRRFRPDATQTAIWNRGAYLAEGIAHCGACHTPRGVLGAEKSNEAYNGAPVEGWHAYAINATSPAPMPWTEEALEFYLRHGWQEHHGVARGPMAPVAMNLATAPGEDVKAIATYIAALAGRPAEDRVKRGQQVLEAAAANKGPHGDGTPDEGALIYAGACATCHESGRPLPYGGLNLSLSTAVNGPNPANIINVTLFGLAQQPGNAGPIMPGFRGSLTDRQMVSLVSYLRARFSSKPPWRLAEQDIGRVRDNVPRLWPAPGVRPMVANSSLEVRPW